MTQLHGVRTLVVGGDGAIGAALIAALNAAGADVAATTRRPDAAAPGWLKLDLADDPSAWRLPPADIVFLTAAMTKLADCRADPDLARRINVQAPLALARRTAEQGGFSIFLSTNQVFSGARPGQRTDDPAAPVSLYGALKAEAETGLRELGEAVAIVRLSKVIGPHLGLFQGWTETLKRGESIRAFHDLVMAPLALPTLIQALLAIAAGRFAGTWHVGGQTDISYAEAGRWLAHRLGVPEALVLETSAAEAGLPEAERPPHTVLDPGEAPARLGLKIGTPDQELELGLAALLAR